jgi:2-methylcitrate dehydratase PrpD
MREATAVLAEFAASMTLEKISMSAQLSTKLLFLDALACAYAGHQGEETTQVRVVAEALAPGSKDSPVIGGGGLSLAGATLFNGYLITAVTMCDVHRECLTHITPEIVPPALGVGYRDDVSGEQLLTSLAIGCEVATRVGIGLDYPTFRRKGWHGPGVLGPFGAAAAVGFLRGFDPGTMARAFALAGSQAAGTFAAWGTPTVKFHQCRGAFSGLLAALTAEQGFVATEQFLTAKDGGLFNTYSDGGSPGRVTDDLGQRWELEQIALRLWPSATALQDVLTALYDLRSKNTFEFDEIERVVVTLAPVPFDMFGKLPHYKAKFEALISGHYVAAAYLRDRELTLKQFEPECYDSPDLRRFAADRVVFLSDKGLGGGKCRVELTLKNGNKLNGNCEDPLGTPENPMSQQQIEEKFHTYARLWLSEAQVKALQEAVMDLENQKSMREFVALINPT